MKITKNLFKISFPLLLIFCSVSFSPVQAEDAVPILPLANPQAIYVLSEHLSEANAVIYVENKESRKGIWENNYFSFYGLDKEGSIEVINETADNQTWQSIQMNSLQGVNRVLQFLNVPSGSGMKFYYKCTLDKPSKQNVYIYVLISAGKKNIARFRVTCNQEGWQKQWISLGV